MNNAFVGLMRFKRSRLPVLSAVFGNRGVSRASEAYVPFEGEKTFWHDGFDRFDYVMDEESFVIMPFKRPEGEKFAVGNPAKGQRRCIVVVPKKNCSR